jgi:antitoxin component YwqK of YwqJK toxin-antitoxin module
MSISNSNSVKITSNSQIIPSIPIFSSKDDYQTLQVWKLKDIVKNKGIKNYSKLKKAELIDILLKEEEKEKIPFTEDPSIHKIEDPIIIKDLIIHIIAGYLDYKDDIPKLELILGEKITDKDRITYKEKLHWFFDDVVIKETYLDLKMIKEEYLENGNLVCEKHYKNGRLDGLGKIWRSDGTLSHEITLKNGKKHGPERYYDTKGILYLEINYKNTRKHGPLKRWWRENKLDFCDEYKEGKRDGICRTWHGNGNIKFEKEYKNDKLNGLWKKYDENGKFKKQLMYKNSKRVYDFDNEYGSKEENNEVNKINEVTEAKRIDEIDTTNGINGINEIDDEKDDNENNFNIAGDKMQNDETKLKMFF